MNQQLQHQWRMTWLKKLMMIVLLLRWKLCHYLSSHDLSSLIMMMLMMEIRIFSQFCVYVLMKEIQYMILMKNNQCLLPINAAIFLFVLVLHLLWCQLLRVVVIGLHIILIVQILILLRWLKILLLLLLYLIHCH